MIETHPARPPPISLQVAGPSDCEVQTEPAAGLEPATPCLQDASRPSRWFRWALYTLKRGLPVPHLTGSGQAWVSKLLANLKAGPAVLGLSPHLEEGPPQTHAWRRGGGACQRTFTARRASQLLLDDQFLDAVPRRSTPGRLAVRRWRRNWLNIRPSLGGRQFSVSAGTFGSRVRHCPRARLGSA